MYSAQRTLVKSAPELWGELSDPDSLARRLGHFGEVRTTGLEPEDTVAWEGDRVRGTVRLEPSGWGTKVTVEVEAKETPPPEPEPGPEAVAEPEPEPEPEPVAEEPEPEPEVAAEPEPEIEPRRGFFARLFGRRRQAGIPGPPAPPAPEPSPPTPTPQPGPPPPPDPSPPQIKMDPPPPPDPSPPQIGLDPERTVAALEAILDDLGSAHHRPFSRA